MSGREVEVHGILLARVIHGTRLLDRHVPGWHERVTKPVNLRDGDECVLGQVFATERRPATQSAYGWALDDPASPLYRFVPRDEGNSRAVIHWARIYGFLGGGKYLGRTYPTDMLTDTLGSMWDDAVEERKAHGRLARATEERVNR